jgi:catechol 2,3-dioxygenase-like lactoylglutathione lyase family enzyme
MDEAESEGQESSRRAGSELRISDVCLLVQDLERSIQFYRDRVGFKLRRVAPGFADFFTDGVTLALWQVDHMQNHLGLPPGRAQRGGWRTMAAIQLSGKDDVHTMHRELSARGVPFLVEPRTYPWNAFACYFTDPEDNLWEIYTWQEGGHANLIFSGEPGP